MGSFIGSVDLGRSQAGKPSYTELIKEVIRDGFEAVGDRHGARITVKGLFDRRTRIGRVLQPMLDDMGIMPHNLDIWRKKMANNELGF